MTGEEQRQLPLNGLRLRSLRTDDERMVRAAHRAMAADRFTFALGLTDGLSWDDYLHQLAAEQSGTATKPDWVPATFLVAEVHGEIIGRVSIRHRLNDWLLARGGHIGYGVLPAHRRRGYATEILRQGLIVARTLGIARVLVTCDDANAASIRVIEQCCGRRDPNWSTSHEPGPVRRYWIA